MLPAVCLNRVGLILGIKTGLTDLRRLSPYRLILFCVVMVSGNALATVYSDAENGSGDWRVVDNNPSGAQVQTVYDEILDSNVIQTSGAARSNSYLTGGTDTATGWNNTSEFHINWRLQATDNFNFFVRVDTALGWRYLYYNQSNSDSLANSAGTYIHHGLGSTAKDGTWRVFSRDLVQDLADAEPDNELIAVNGVVVRGDVRLDDITLATEPVAQTVLPPVSSVVNADAEDGSVAGWRVFDNNPVGATISIVTDEVTDGQVYELNGAERTNGYQLGGTSAVDGWNNRQEHFLSWDMRVGENYTLLVRVDTELGWRYLAYTQSNSDRLLSSNGRYIYYGFGTATRDNEWRSYSRDLAADLANGEPGNTLIAVHGLFIRGSMRLDDILLSASDAAAVAPIALIADGDQTINVGDSLTLNGSISTDNDGTIETYQWTNDAGDVLGSEAQLIIAPEQPGTFIYTLTVTDDSGLSDAASVSITVEQSVVDDTIPSVYEDAEDSETSRWVIADASPAGATIANVFDENSDSRVMELAGTAQQNSFLIGYFNGSRESAWNNSTQTHIRWSMKTDQTYSVIVHLETADGDRTLIYDHYVTVRGSSGASSLRIGLGTGVMNGNWHTVTRNVAADLATLQPENTLIAVHGMQFRGNFRVDNIDMVTIVDAPPLASLSADVHEAVGMLSANFDAGASFDDVGVVNYRFDFGDGSDLLNSVEPQVSYTYSEPGDYTATVTVSDASLQSDTASVVIRVLEDTTSPVASLIASSLEGAVPFAATFDASGSTDNVAITSYAWDYGDGSSESGADLSIVNHEYVTEGEYTVVVTVVDAAGNQDVSSVAVKAGPDTPADEPPVAAFSYISYAGSTVTFVNESTDDLGVSSVAWDFGDATETGVSDLENPTYSYSSIGEYTVALTAVDTIGQKSTTTQALVIDELDDPVDELVAVATVNVQTGEAPLSVSFDASASSGGQGELSYQWQLDDIAGNGPTFQVELATAGTYTATLTIIDEREQSAVTTVDIIVTEPTEPPGSGVTAAAAARLLAQATFGPSSAGIERVQALGIEGWIDEQFTLLGEPHLDYVLANSNGSGQEARHNVWWRDVVEGEDQLRQRMAFALSQIFVVSDQGYTLGNAQYGVTRYYDQLRENAFGSYRELLEDVTLSPVMGVYLSMLQNEKGDAEGNTRADENYAREVLQLFSIGLHELNTDGTQKLSGGKPIATFTQTDIENYARAFTGWNFGGATDWTLASINSRANKQIPMEPVDQFHDKGAKSFLGGVTAAAGLSAEQDLEIALDSIANHPNVGPFISKQLIQKLVTSNPTTGYVSRVSSVFNNNGHGVRGDLKAVTKAILMDDEARNGHLNVPHYGKLREPVLRLSHLWRAFNITPGNQSVNGVYNVRSPHVKDLDYVSGQAVLKSPSVFNFYHPDYAPLGPVYDAGKKAPEAEIYTDGAIINMTTRMNTHIQYVHDASDSNAKKWSYIVLAQERALAAASTDALLDRLDLLLLSGAMSDGLREILIDHLETLPSKDTEDGQSARVRDALTLIMASPEYLVQM